MASAKSPRNWLPSYIVFDASKYLLLLFVMYIFPFCSLFAKTVDHSYEYLDTLALAAGTDKSSSFHNYTRIYSKYFDAIRNDPIKFLEIGIYRGNSVKLWESYFPNAELHFIDIDPGYIQYHSLRSKYHFIDASNVKSLQVFINSIEGDFDIILDDGGHQMQQQITSFQTLFPYVRSGGLYIIEDLHTSYWKEYGGHGRVGAPVSGQDTCTDFLKNLVDEMNYSAGVNECADPNKISPDLRQRLNYYQDNIDAIHFYKSVCIIIKK